MDKRERRNNNLIILHNSTSPRLSRISEQRITNQRRTIITRKFISKDEIDEVINEPRITTDIEDRDKI